MSFSAANFAWLLDWLHMKVITLCSTKLSWCRFASRRTLLDDKAALRHTSRLSRYKSRASAMDRSCLSVLERSITPLFSGMKVSSHK